MNVSRLCLQAVFAATGLVLAGVSAMAGDPQPGDPKLDPCSLLTRAEVEQVVGKLKANPTSSRVERVLMCEYELTDGTSALSVWVFPVTAMERAHKEFKQDIVPVKGLGEEAFMHDDKNLDSKDLFVKQGNAVVKVSVPIATHGGAEKIQTLGRKAVPRLKSG